MDRLEAHRHFYASLVTTSVGAAKNERLKDAFASTPRERFVGAGPWKVFAGGNYIETPTDDPAFLYQDVVVALAPERRINNGQPVLHTINLAALHVKQGEKVLHVGAGTGYYTAVLARLAGAAGTVVAPLEAPNCELGTGNQHSVTRLRRFVPSSQKLAISGSATSECHKWTLSWILPSTKTVLTYGFSFISATVEDDTVSAAAFRGFSRRSRVGLPGGAPMRYLASSVLRVRISRVP